MAKRKTTEGWMWKDDGPGKLRLWASSLTWAWKPKHDYCRVRGRWVRVRVTEVKATKGKAKK